MEIGLQPCGFLSAHQGTSLIDPDADLYFRNLDGTGHLHREVDLRGRTVRARVELTSSTALSGVILQKFTYELECDGDVFFDGEASFGYFQGSALAEQIGLDGGRSVRILARRVRARPCLGRPRRIAARSSGRAAGDRTSACPARSSACSTAPPSSRTAAATDWAMSSPRRRWTRRAGTSPATSTSIR